MEQVWCGLKVGDAVFGDHLPRMTSRLDWLHSSRTQSRPEARNSEQPLAVSFLGHELWRLLAEDLGFLRNARKDVREGPSGAMDGGAECGQTYQEKQKSHRSNYIEPFGKFRE